MGGYFQVGVDELQAAKYIIGSAIRKKGENRKMYDNFFGLGAKKLASNLPWKPRTAQGRIGPQVQAARHRMPGPSCLYSPAACR